MRSVLSCAAVIFVALSLQACGGSEDDPDTVIVDADEATATIAEGGAQPFCQGVWMSQPAGHSGNVLVCMCPTGSNGCHTCGPQYYQSNGGYCNGGGPTGPQPGR